MARMQVIIVVVVIVVAAVAAGVLFLGSGKSQSGTGSTLIDLSIVESDPIAQSDSFVPTNVTVAHGTMVTLAVMNGDDQARTFVLSAFGVNQTIDSGTTQRITFTVGQAGTYQMLVPATPASSAVNHRASPAVIGYLIAT